MTLAAAAPRNATLDIAKGLGIVLVVLGHNPLVEYTKAELFRVVFSFHMPLFLFLSGVVLKATDAPRRFVESRALGLLKPYFVVCVAIGLIKLAAALAGRGDFDAADYFLGVLYGTGRTLFWIPMWYLPHLFVASVLAFWLARAVPSRALLALVAAALLCLGVLTLRPTDWPWSVDLLPLTVPFVLAGWLSREAVSRLRFQAPAFTAALVAFTALHFALDQTVDINIRRYDSLVVATAQAALGIYLCLALSSLLANVAGVARVLTAIGAGTLFILIFHIFFQWKTYNVMLAALPQQALLASLLGLVAGVALPLVLQTLVKRSSALSALLLR